MLLRSIKTKFEVDFKDNLESIKRHLMALESETTLAHRREMHCFVAESRAGMVNSMARCSNVETDQVRNIHPYFDVNTRTESSHVSRYMSGWHR